MRVDVYGPGAPPMAGTTPGTGDQAAIFSAACGMAST
jgi:hypothetical protein